MNYLERLRAWEEIDSLVRIDLSRSVNTLSSYREGASSCSRCYVDKVGLIFL